MRISSEEDPESLRGAGGNGMGPHHAVERMKQVGEVLSVRALWGQILLVIAIVIVLPATEPRGGSAPAVDLTTLRRSLESPDCRVRRAAVLEAWRNLVPEEEPGRYLESLRQAVQESQGELRRRLTLLAQDAEAEAISWQTRRKELFFGGRVRGARSREEQAKRIEKSRKLYLTTIKNPEETPVVRLNAAGQMLFAIDRFHQFSQQKSSPFPPGVQGVWTSDVVRLLKDRDPTVRLIGAIVVGQGPGIPGHAVLKGPIIRELIAGLRHSQFHLRIGSQTTLDTLTNWDSCLDPTDPEDLREPEIRKWERWWSIGKKKLSHEKLSGS